MLGSQVWPFEVFICSVVAELDIPWDSTQVAQYGQHFRAWTSREYTDAVQALHHATPYVNFALVVHLLRFTSLQTYHAVEQRKFVRTALTTHFRDIQDFYISKTGMC